MGQALYRKYRSKSLSEVVGQEHITSTLQNALKKGAISHAYLFTGPRGVGKTSVARILAHEINGLPYNDDSMHLDIIEIDAASNRRIDEIRELRDKVNVAPTQAKYKVYIIDEVHMLTREAFNALLKTLEEPPAHVVFILATTEVHKLPETIVSRTQRFSFKPVENKKVVEHLRFIATQEKINIDDPALEQIARYGEGSFRDSISLLDQAGGAGVKVDANYIQAILGIAPQEIINKLIKVLADRDSAELIALMSELRAQGYEAIQVARQLEAEVRNQIINGNADASWFKLSEKLLELPAAYDPDRYFEIVLLDHVFSGGTTAKPAPAASVETAIKPEEKPSKPAAKKPETPAEEPEVIADIKEAKPAEFKHASGVLDDAIWPQVLKALKQNHNTLYGIVRMAEPRFTDDAVEMSFTFPFHQKRLSDAKNQTIVSDIIKQVTGRSFKINCVLAAKPAVKSAAAATSSDSDQVISEPVKQGDNSSISAISNIFGGAELLES